jgi:hypothetical protein
MSLLLAGITVFGFSHTVPMDLAPPGLPLLLKLHAAIFVTWVLLFIAQPSLIVTGNAALHRRLGWIGLALAVGMVGLAPPPSSLRSAPNPCRPSTRPACLSSAASPASPAFLPSSPAPSNSAAGQTGTSA